MIVVMDMSTGKRPDEEEFGEHADEILNANWLPLPAPPLQEAVDPAARKPAQQLPPLDIDEFLRLIYRNQE